MQYDFSVQTIPRSTYSPAVRMSAAQRKFWQRKPGFGKAKRWFGMEKSCFFEVLGLQTPVHCTPISFPAQGRSQRWLLKTNQIFVFSKTKIFQDIFRKREEKIATWCTGGSTPHCRGFYRKWARQCTVIFMLLVSQNEKISWRIFDFEQTKFLNVFIMSLDTPQAWETDWIMFYPT